MLPVILDKLGRFMNADRSYVFMLRDGKLYNEYEWCAEGVESQMDMLQVCLWNSSTAGLKSLTGRNVWC